MLPAVHCTGNIGIMRGNSESLSTAMETSNDDVGPGAADESFLPPIESRWANEVHEELAFADNDDDVSQDHKGIQSRRHGDKKLSKSGRFIVNKSSMSDSFVLPNIAFAGSLNRKSRTAGSNWSHGGDNARARNGIPISKSCPVLKNRNGYQWGKDSSEDEDDDDLASDYLSVSFNVMSKSEREKASRHESGQTSRLARLETKKATPKPTSTNTNSSSLGETKLPDIFDRSPRRCSKDDNNNGAHGAQERRRARKNGACHQQKSSKTGSSEAVDEQEMDYELNVAPWRGEREVVQIKQNGNDIEAVVGEENGVEKSNSAEKPKAKRKGSNRRPPITAKNPDSKCRDWLQDSHH